MTCGNAAPLGGSIVLPRFSTSCAQACTVLRKLRASPPCRRTPVRRIPRAMTRISITAMPGT